MEAIERAVAAVTDPADEGQVAGALRAVSPAMIDDVVFGVASSTHGAAADGELLGIGFAASPGVGVGRVVFSASAALDAFAAEAEVVLVVDETTPTDEPAMRIAAAVVTRRGGVASHAGIVARQWGVPCVCGIGDLDVVGGDQLLVDGSTGEVRRLEPASGASGDGSAGPATLPGHIGPLQELPPAVATLLDWADAVAVDRLAVLANADLAADVRLALDLGARGVGLCRTEHQFLGDGAALVVRALDGEPDALAELAQRQRADLAAVLVEAAPRPVTIRLLDAPRHEFDPTHAEHDPMLGLRGVRAAIVHPSLCEAQAEAIAHAVADATEHARTTGVEPSSVTVLVPMVSLSAELEWARSVVLDACFRVGVERGTTPDVKFGTMIETPRAALCADGLAPLSDSFSFGTNDLTQLTWGWSRDDLDASLLPTYRAKGLLERSPFETLDGSGVVRLMALAAQTGRARKPELAITMCGEHGGDPASIAIALQLGLDAVSVSPYRVPATRLAVAHAVLGPERTTTTEGEP